jgi:hypothetical protein
MAPIRLQRQGFFVPGCIDQGGLCWVEPYTEGGVDCRSGWEYSLRDWVERVVDPADRRHVHFLRLVADEACLRIERYPAGSRRGKVKCVVWDDDATARYDNFFQFAELLKQQIRASGITDYDVVSHSMGGLDSIAAIAVDVERDTEPEVRRFITTPPLAGVNRLITVATPFHGSPGGRLVKHTKLDEVFMRDWPLGIRQQAEAMSTDSPFIRIIAHPERQRRLAQSVAGRVHTFGSNNDIVVPDPSRMIDGAINHPAAEFTLARHSQWLGIPQDPRLALAVFTILAG